MTKMNVSSFDTAKYAKLVTLAVAKNKPNSNPIKPNSNPIKPNSNPIKAQSNPKQTQFSDHSPAGNAHFIRKNKTF